MILHPVNFTTKIIQDKFPLNFFSYQTYICLDDFILVSCFKWERVIASLKCPTLLLLWQVSQFFLYPAHWFDLYFCVSPVMPLISTVTARFFCTLILCWLRFNTTMCQICHKLKRLSHILNVAVVMVHKFSVLRHFHQSKFDQKTLPQPRHRGEGLGPACKWCVKICSLPMGILMLSEERMEVEVGEG